MDSFIVTQGENNFQVTNFEGLFTPNGDYQGVFNVGDTEQGESPILIFDFSDSGAKND